MVTEREILRAVCLVPASMLADKPMARDALPRMVSRQVQRLLDEAGDRPVRWASLSVVMVPMPSLANPTSYEVTATVVTGESPW